MRTRRMRPVWFAAAAALLSLTVPADASTGVDDAPHPEADTVLLDLDTDLPTDADRDPLAAPLEGRRGKGRKGKGKGRKGDKGKRKKDGEDGEAGEGEEDGEKRKRRRRRRKKKDEGSDA